jgi:hypothetical protein
VTSHHFDVDEFLQQPLTARTATNGPTVRPVWFLWEAADESRWDARFVHYLHDDPGERGTMWLRLVPTSLTAQDLSYFVTS